MALQTTLEPQYSAEYLSSLPEADQIAFLGSLTRKELIHLQHDWRFWAREKQLPPAGLWYVWMLLSGRGFGKTWVGANMVIEFARGNPDYPIALIGQTKADCRDTMVEVGDSSILKQSPPDFIPHYEPSKRRLTWPNGAIGMVYSGDEPDQLRGPQHGFAWLDELSKFKYPTRTWDNMEFGLRLGDNPQVVVTNTPRPIPIIKQLLADSDTVTTRGSTYENAPNLPARTLARWRKKYEGTRLGRQELHGHILDDNPKALWKRAMFEKNRVTEVPDLKKIVVAVDPQAVDNPDDPDATSDTGIVVAGVGYNDHGYVLDDMTLSASPDGWGRAVVTGYHKYKADGIVAEKNNGGDMVGFVLKTIDRRVPFELVWASRNKRTRAEPVSALYEQKRIHHVGLFAELEDQCCQWEPGEDSPDRLDALVWALTALMLEDSGPLTVGVKEYA